MGFFGSLFDFNGDGELDSFERAMDFMAFDEMMEDDERRKKLEDEEFEDEEF